MVGPAFRHLFVDSLFTSNWPSCDACKWFLPIPLYLSLPVNQAPTLSALNNGTWNLVRRLLGTYGQAFFDQHTCCIEWIWPTTWTSLFTMHMVVDWWCWARAWCGSWHSKYMRNMRHGSWDHSSLFLWSFSKHINYFCGLMFLLWVSGLHFYRTFLS